MIVCNGLPVMSVLAIIFVVGVLISLFTMMGPEGPVVLGNPLILIILHLDGNLGLVLRISRIKDVMGINVIILLISVYLQDLVEVVFLY